jgi:hypothetical protein
VDDPRRRHKIYHRRPRDRVRCPVTSLLVAFRTLLAVGVGVHAGNRDPSGFVWGLVTFLTGLLGVFVYLLVLLTEDSGGEDEETIRVCPACSARLTGSPAYCPDCGEPLGDDTFENVNTTSELRAAAERFAARDAE